jgi:hypothetical protein
MACAPTQTTRTHIDTETRGVEGWKRREREEGRVSTGGTGLEKPPGLGGGTAAKAGWKDLRSRWLGTFLALPERVPDVDEPNETDPDVTASKQCECVCVCVEWSVTPTKPRAEAIECDRARTHTTRTRAQANRDGG